MGKLIHVLYGEKPLILGMYSRNKGVVYATPEGTSHLAHATWLNPGARNADNRGNIDYFIIENRDASKVYSLVNTNSLQVPSPSLNQEEQETERKHAVSYQIPKKFQHLEAVARRAAIRDIWDFTHGKPAPKILGNPKIEYVLGIEPEAKIKHSGYADLDVTGKQDFYPECILDINLDFARWCMSNITPDRKLNPNGACEYCYSAYKHSSYPHVFKVDAKRLVRQILEARKERENLGLRTKYLRLGKRTEAGADIFHEQIISVLEACLETGISAVFPTKYLRFNKEIADLLKRTNSTLLPSFGNDRFEQGACAHGCTSEWRFEQGILFKEAGVRVVPYLLVDAVKEDGGKFFQDNLKKAEQLFPRVQILPIRIRYEDVGKRILEGWTEILGQHKQDFFGKYIGGYERSKDYTRLAVHIHPSLSSRIGENNRNCRMCHHNSQKTWCGKCFVNGETGRVIKTQEVIVKRKVKRPHKMKRDNHPQLNFED